MSPIWASVLLLIACKNDQEDNRDNDGGGAETETDSDPDSDRDPPRPVEDDVVYARSHAPRGHTVGWTKRIALQVLMSAALAGSALAADPSERSPVLPVASPTDPLTWNDDRLARTFATIAQARVDEANLVLTRSGDSSVRRLAELVVEREGPMVRRTQEWLRKNGAHGVSVAHDTTLPPPPRVTPSPYGAQPIDGTSRLAVDVRVREQLAQLQKLPIDELDRRYVATTAEDCRRLVVAIDAQFLPRAKDLDLAKVFREGRARIADELLEAQEIEARERFAVTVGGTP